MKKTLINHRNLNKYLDDTLKEFIVDETMIIAPSALDKIKEKNINIIYKKSGAVNKLMVNKIRSQIKEYLNNEYNINNRKEVEKFIDKVMSKIEMEGYYGDQ